MLGKDKEINDAMMSHGIEKCGTSVVCLPQRKWTDGSGR